MEKKNSLVQEIKSLVTNRNLLLIILMTTLNSCATTVSKTYINQFGKDLGIGVAILGFIATANSWGKILSRPFSGRGMDKFDPRKWMIACISLRIATYLVFAVFDGTVAYGVARFMEGVTLSLMMTSSYSLTSLCVTKAQIGTALALYSLVPSLFMALATMLSAAAYAFNPKMPFYCSVILLVGMLVLTFFLKMPARNTVETNASDTAKNTGRPAEKKKFKLSNYIAFEGLWFLPMMWCNSAHLATEDLLIAVYAGELGYPAAGAAYFAMGSLVKSWAVVPAGALADRIGAKWVIYFGFACKAVGYVLLALNPSVMMFTVAGVLKGVAQPMQNVMQAQAIRIMPKSKTGIANSTHLLLTDIGVMLMSALAGMACAAMGYSSAFIVFGIVAFGGAISYGLLNRKIENMIAASSKLDEA